MSIMRCERHDGNWDSDKLDECPLCENDPQPSTAHTDHPLRHYDRTCPACNPAGAAPDAGEKWSEATLRKGGR